MGNVSIETVDHETERERTSQQVEAARAITVTNTDEQRQAAEFLQLIAAGRKKVVGLFAPSKAAAHKAHRSICAAEASVLEPLDTARRIVEPKILAFEHEQRRKAEEEAARLAEEARKAEEARALEDAIAAEEAGEVEEAEAILEEPVAAPVVDVEPEVAKVANVNSRSTFSAEVEDLDALIKFVAANPSWRHLLAPVQKELNALARSQKNNLDIPGVRVMEKRSLAVGARS